METINSTVLEFHTNNETLPFPMAFENEKFGIFTVKMEKTDISTIPLFILFTIDKTGSMCEWNGDNRSSKMDYVKQTFRNMISYLAKQDLEIYICVQSFNCEVSVDVEKERVSRDNMECLIQKIDALFPEGSTNIELALTKATETLQYYGKAFPEHQIAHIFMTDGEPTLGKCSKSELAELVDDRFANIFVGFGIDHNSSLLKTLSDKKNGEYQFVDNMENTSLVYGETIHRFLYPALSQVHIRVNNGLIYDWQTNTWTEQIYEPVLVSEVEKTYQIKSSTNNLMTVEIWSDDMCVCNDFAMPELVDENGETIEHDLSKYSFRLKVQELLFGARNLDTRNLQDKMKIEFKRVFKKMRVYMRENALVDDPFMKLLCDDISVTYRTMGTRAGHAYASARQTSQGRQQSYTPAQCVDNNQDIFNLTRSNAIGAFPRQNSIAGPSLLEDENSQQEFENMQMHRLDVVNEDGENGGNVENPIDEDDLDNFLPSNSNVSCYVTQSGLQTMRSMSQGVNDCNI
uniref:VWFA domain-containing protein n=1 Tax=viral metagenome TaxID=1070528 RepID=A0A6C0JHN5_9ZZZZ